MERFFAGAARILLSRQNQHHVPYCRPPEPRNIFVSVDFVIDDTSYCACRPFQTARDGSIRARPIHATLLHFIEVTLQLYDRSWIFLANTCTMIIGIFRSYVNSRPAGGGGIFCPLSDFLDSLKTAADVNAKLLVPSPPSVYRLPPEFQKNP